MELLVSLFPFPKANTKHLRHYVLGVNEDAAAVPKGKKGVQLDTVLPLVPFS